jgi:glycosyltransferase involved in cell wall biosynthesis
VTAQVPDMGSGGGGVRQAALLRALASAAETHLVLAGTLLDDGLRDALASVREVPAGPTPLPSGATRRRIRHLADAFVGPAERVSHRPVRRALAGLLENAASFDVVVIDSIGLAPLLPEHRTNRWVLNLHNRPSGMAAHRRGFAVGRRRRWLLGREERLARRFERQAARAFDLVVTVSEPDASGLDGSVVVVRNGVDTEQLRSTPLPESSRLVFTAAMYTLPNIDGAIWFCDRVFPIVRRAVPDATVELVGRAPVPEVVALGARPGVVVRPDVASVAPHLEQARVAVVPIRIGTGTRLKALEAMAAGRPVVGTTIGLEGLDVVHGEHAWIADGAEDLAAGIVRVLQDADLASRLAAAGRGLVEEGYDWRAIGDDYVRVLLGGE